MARAIVSTVESLYDFAKITVHFSTVAREKFRFSTELRDKKLLNDFCWLNHKANFMVKAFSFLLVGFFLILTIPLIIGLGAGFFGLAIGLIGGLFGILFGLLGAIIGAIAWVFKSMFHLLFGWHLGFGHHHGFHPNGYILAAIIILILAVVLNKKK